MPKRGKRKVADNPPPAAKKKDAPTTQTKQQQTQSKKKNKTNNDDDIIESRLSVPLENDDEVENISCDTTVSEEKKTKHNY